MTGTTGNNKNSKDAADLAVFFAYYADAGNIDRLFQEESALLEEEEFDLELAAIRLLGRDIGNMLQAESRKRVLAILARETEEGGRNKLVEDLAKYYDEQDDQFVKNLLQLKKLKQGIEEGNSSAPI